MKRFEAEKPSFLWLLGAAFCAIIGLVSFVQALFFGRNEMYMFLFPMLLLSLFFYIAWRGRGAIRAYAVHRDRISIEGRDVDIPFDKINDIAVSSPPCRWLHDGAYETIQIIDMITIKSINVLIASDFILLPVIIFFHFFFCIFYK